MDWSDACGWLQIGYFDPEEAYRLDDWWSQQCCIKPVIEISRDKAMEQTTGSCSTARWLVVDSALGTDR